MTPDSAETAIPLVAQWVADETGGVIVQGDPAREFANVSIDTRTLTPDDLFIAIRGDRFDGSEFAAAAIAVGAGGVVVPRGWLAQRSGRPWSAIRAEHEAIRAEQAPPLGEGAAVQPVVIEVDDTTTALQRLGRAVRRASGTKVVAITGSAGKTTTKEVTSEFLAARYRVIRNRGNLNNHIGLPLSLIELRQRPEIAVVELGMNHAGEISTLTRLAEPDVRVWTNVGEAHLGFFASLDAIADAKAEILEGADTSTLLVANADDERITTRMGGFAGRTVTFGVDHDADVRARGVIDRGIEGVEARVTTARGEIDLRSPLIGRGNLSNVLAAAAVALECDVPLNVIRDRAAHLKPAAHRGEVVRLRDHVIVIDDSYNANPTATRRALEVLAGSSAGRRVAVLGEMLELGARAVDLHEVVGRAAATAPVDLLFAVGGTPAAALASAAIASGMSADSVRHYATSDAAADAVAAVVQPGDLVLVKGSRGIRTDRVVDRLKAERT
jgi:UDP-N-acetylmuramoyl-tripeptide--D-alanyl-D-alanine ligase